MLRALRGTFLCGLALALAPAALAEERIGVRVGDHPGYGRIVFDWPRAPAYRLEQAGETVTLQFPDGAAIDLPGVRRLPRNVLGVAATARGIEITLRPGARARHFRHGPKVVVDLVDPAAEQATGARTAMRERTRVAARLESQVPRPAASQAPSPVEPPPPAPSAASQPPPPVEPAPPVPSAATQPPGSEPPAIAPAVSEPASVLTPMALPLRLVTGPGGGRAVILPFPAGTGAAVLRRGDLLLAVFDVAVPLDLSALRGDPVFGGAEAVLLPNATLLRLALAPPATLRPWKEGNAWLLEAVRPAAASDGQDPSRNRPLVPSVEPGAAPRLLLRATQPSRVVPLTDPESGLPLLVGTVGEAGQAVPVSRRLPEMDLPATLLGAAVLARADSVTMHAAPDHFTIAAAAGGRFALDTVEAEGMAGPAMTRLFDLPVLPVPQQLERLRAQQAAIIAAPPLARLPQRLAAAESLLALGMAHEAQAMLGLALGEDPRAAAEPRLAALSGAAALLAGRPAEAGGLQKSGLPESDELTFWRAVLAVTQGEPRRAAPGFAATLPLLLAYPPHLRSRLAPLVAEALAEAGELDTLRRLLAATAPEELSLARAMLAEAEGRTEDALAAYDVLARGRDRRARARALRRAVELRLAIGRIDAKAAAQALESTLFAWRGGEEEFAARLRLAELHRLAGEPRRALTLLRETETLYPDRVQQARPEMTEAFLAALAQESPLTAVVLFDTNLDLLPNDSRAESAVLLLVDKLLALDLADRASGVLRQAAERATGPARAGLGLRLAKLRLAEGDAEGAKAALTASAVPDLPPALLLNRNITMARAEARDGQVSQAVERLRALGPPGAEALAELLINAQDWTGAAAAMAEHLRAALPAAPEPLTDSHRLLLLRQAAILALAGDTAGLALLRSQYADRMQGGRLAEPFAALTADPLRGLADLPRLQRELRLFQGMPARLEALRTGGPVTR